MPESETRYDLVLSPASQKLTLLFRNIPSNCFSSCIK